MTAVAGRWGVERANAWFAAQPWRLGCNFVPSTAINQLEMFEAATFDAETLDRELAWAADIGFNSMRVYLHDLAWQRDPEGFLGRVDRYLEIAASHGICTLLVIFDDCWNEPQPGPQPAPRPGVHNSGWLQSPGRVATADPAQRPRLRDYVGAVIERFGADERVLAWDLFNEPTNDFLPYMSLPAAERDAQAERIGALRAEWRAQSLQLLEDVFVWAREAAPAQPLTAGVWIGDEALSARLVELSDVISFHHYRSPGSLERTIARLRAHGRPLLCTEYMARTDGCTFQTHLPVFERENVACWNWGLVDGKSQTKYTWTERGTGEPDLWFHDVLHPDGSPYRDDEVALIRALAAGRNARS